MLKATGVVRRFDDLGRIVIPKELRDAMGVGPHFPVEFLTDDDGSIVLRPWAGACVFCGVATSEDEAFGGKRVCGKCRAALAERV